MCVVGQCFHEKGVDILWSVEGVWAGREPALKTTLEVDGYSVEVCKIKCCRLARSCVCWGHICENEGLAAKGAPKKRSQTVTEREKQTLLKEPGLMGCEMVLELDKVAGSDGLTEREKDGSERLRLWTLQESLGREAAEEDVARDEISQDVCAMRDELGRSLEVGVLQTEGGAVIVTVGEVETAEIVKKGDALGGRVE